MHRRKFCQSTVASAVAAAIPFGASRAADSRIVADVEAIGLNGDQITLPKAAVKEFAASLRGDVMLRDHADYEKARSIWNGIFNRHPALIARCTGAADVINAVSFARDNGLLLSVRAGGHSISGKSMCEGGLTIDVTPMNDVRVDVARQTARVASGALLGALDHESMRFNLATTSGTVSHTGVAGLTLGGGMGRLARIHGLACDNVLSIDVVTADGRLLTASREQNSDLFWGLRGGGGNFGVATSFEFELQPARPTVLAGAMMYPLTKVGEVMDFYVEYTRSAPRELSLSAVLVMPPNGKGMAILSPSYMGTLEDGERVLAPLRAFGKPLADHVRPVSYVALQKNNDNGLPAGLNYYLKSGYVNEVTPALVEALVEKLQPSTKRSESIVINQLGGAIADVENNATAYAHRAAANDMILGSSWKDPAFSDENVQWGRDFWKSVVEYTAGFYVNNLMDEGDRRIQSNYGENYARLVELKNAYDPTNLFRLNANIVPTV